METQKIKNLLNGSHNENSKFATKRWYIVDNESKGNYSRHNPIKLLTKPIKSSLCNYSYAYILVTGNIKDCKTEINATFVDYIDFINIAIPMYNLIEYSDNCSDTSGSLRNSKRDEIIGNINKRNKSNLIGNTDADEANRKNKM